MKLKKLKLAYEKAKKENKKMFEIEGYKFVTDYAKYLLEYLKDVKKLNNNSEIDFKEVD